MASAPPQERVELALRAPEPFNAVMLVAEQLQKEGMPQSEMLKLFNELRARYECSSDEGPYNIVLDVLDRIVGWCSPSKRISLEGTE